MEYLFPSCNNFVAEHECLFFYFCGTGRSEDVAVIVMMLCDASLQRLFEALQLAVGTYVAPFCGLVGSSTHARPEQVAYNDGSGKPWRQQAL